MRYKLYVPAGYKQIRDNGKEYVEKLKMAGAETVFIVPDINEVWFGTEERVKKHIADIKFCVDILKSQGFTVGVWFNCFGVGSKLPDSAKEKARKYIRKKSIIGVGGEDWREKNITGFCCEDESFREDFGLVVEEFASTNPDMIMLDDDMCISVVPGLGCFCEKHMQIYREILGENVTAEQMKELVFTGYNKKYRKAWLKGVGDSLRKFAQSVRDSINKVNPSIRAGFATGYTSFDIEGADAFELSEIMAGDTLPFLRLTGAPYWCETNMLGGRFTGQKTPTVIEYVRIQKEWAKGRKIEFFYEGDTYPRSAYYTSAAMCEAFDLAIRAIGGINGQKYLFSYSGEFTSPYFENTYYEKHLKNKEFYKFIEDNFSGKTDVGVKIYEKMSKMEVARLPEKFAGEVQIMEGLSIPSSPALFSVQGIPLTCGKSSVAVAFGDSVKEVEKLPDKLIVDIKSALILQNEMGIDLGIKSYKPTELPKHEIIDGFSLRIWMQTDTPAYYECELSPEIELSSYFIGRNANEFPASYIRKVGNTEFLVYLFDMAYIEGHNELLLSYPRKEQLVRFIGNKLPYVSSRCSSAYTVCKTDGKDTAILVQNYWEDTIDDLTVQLDKEYKDFEIFGAEGKLDGDKFILTTALYPLRSVAIVLKG